MDQLVFITMCCISILLAINCWLLWYGGRALNDEVKLMRRPFSWKFAIRDLMRKLSADTNNVMRVNKTLSAPMRAKRDQVLNQSLTLSDHGPCAES